MERSKKGKDERPGYMELPPVKGDLVVGRPGRLARGVLRLGDRLPEGIVRRTVNIIGGNLPHKFPKRKL